MVWPVNAVDQTGNDNVHSPSDSIEHFLLGSRSLPLNIQLFPITFAVVLVYYVMLPMRSL